MKMNAVKNYATMDLVLGFDGIFYKIARLSFTKIGESKEFFYHFAYSEDIDKKIFNCNKNQKSGRPDHISFHGDGRVHITLAKEKKNNKYIGQRYFSDGYFVPEKSVITPLLIHSLYRVDDEWILPIYVIDSGQSGKIVLDKNTVGFSIILFLVPEEFVVANLDIYGKSIGQIIVWNGWKVVVVIGGSLPLLNVQHSLLVKDTVFMVFMYEKLDGILLDKFRYLG